MVDLSIAFHLLIHINLESLNAACELLYKLSTRFILIWKYFNPTTVAISYRGQEIDFSGEIYPGKSGHNTLV